MPGHRTHSPAHRQRPSRRRSHGNDMPRTPSVLDLSSRLRFCPSTGLKEHMRTPSNAVVHRRPPQTQRLRAASVCVGPVRGGPAAGQAGVLEDSNCRRKLGCAGKPVQEGSLDADPRRHHPRPRVQVVSRQSAPDFQPRRHLHINRHK